MSARVEAAAKAAHEFDTAHCPSFTWESAAEGWRKADRERQAAALAAADQIMFSEAAIERAADEVLNHWRQTSTGRCECGEFAGKDPQQIAQHLTRAVVAALREGA